MFLGDEGSSISDLCSVLIATLFLLTFSIFNVRWNSIDQGDLIGCN